MTRTTTALSISGVMSAAMLTAACHPGPVNAELVPVGGTIAGIVRATGGTIGLTTRHITITNTATGAKFEGTTGPDGGYTIKVPEGMYHIDVEVREGETVSKRPDDT